MTKRPESGLDRRTFLGLSIATGAAMALPLGAAQKSSTSVKVEEISLAELQAGLESGKWTSVSLVQAYEARIHAVDKSGAKLNSILELNPDALKIAAELDRERKAKGPRGPMHGIPVLVKDNLDTADRMKTTAGSLALVDAPTPKQDAFVVAQLRAAGAIILGKTNLSEWANLRSTHSISGWSGRGGQTRNPYALDRNPSGSSSGSGAAASASLCAAAIGTETDGSIVSPASINGLVGLKPTVGLVSRAGIIPISHTQDTAGPVTRTVRDAAILLGAIAGSDPKDKATVEADQRKKTDYTQGFDSGALRGARLGLVKNLLGQNPHVDRMMTAAVETLKHQGATVVEVEITSTPYEAAELEVLLFEFKSGLNAYFAQRGGVVKNLADIIAFNEREKAREMSLFGQELLIQAEAKGPLTDPAYLKALEACRQARKDIETALDKDKLDALVGPTGAPAWLIDPVNGDSSGLSFSTPAAVAGCPHLTVPAGFAMGLPLGISFVGRPWDEQTLLRLGYAFEQATQARRAPGFLTTVLLS